MLNQLIRLDLSKNLIHNLNPKYYLYFDEDKKILALLKILKFSSAPELNCLDFGCGSGDKVKFLRDNGYNFVGCDIAFKEGNLLIF